MEDRYVKFKKDYFHQRQRKEGDVVKVRVPDQQITAWKDAGVADEASEAEVKAAETKAKRAASTQTSEEKK